MDTAKIYYDSDDNECTIHQMVKREPQWAANRIQEGEAAIAKLAELESSRSPGCYASVDMWEAYGPSRINYTFDCESSVGPTANNDVPGPLAVVSGDTPEESLANAKRIAELLNRYGLKDA